MSLAADMQTTEANANVVAERTGSLGVIRLDRPEALNATTLAMIRAIDLALDRFERDPAVGVVLIEGAGERAFCAGGDIRAIHDSGRAGDGLAETFWREEYRLVSRISRYPKPYVALMDGIVMGGGVGISVHGSCRVVTERTRLAMPEVGIGFIPDVGATWIMAGAPGRSGAYVALTGAPIGAADAIFVGMADIPVASARLADLKGAIAALRPDEADQLVDETVRSFASPPERGLVERNAMTIDRIFASGALESVLESAGEQGAGLDAEIAKALAMKSPTSLKLALELLARARTSASLEECLVREFDIALRTLKGRDFYEGVRAAVIDKDRRPRWSPAVAEQVDAETIAAYLAPDDTRSLRFAT